MQIKSNSSEGSNSSFSRKTEPFRRPAYDLFEQHTNSTSNSRISGSIPISEIVGTNTASLGAIATGGRFGASVRISKPSMPGPFLVNGSGVAQSIPSDINSCNLKNPAMASRARISSIESGAARIPQPRFSGSLSIQPPSRDPSPPTGAHSISKLNANERPRPSPMVIDSSLFASLKNEKWEVRTDALNTIKEIFSKSNQACPIEKLIKIISPLIDVSLYDKHGKVVLLSFDVLEILLTPFGTIPNPKDLAIILNSLSGRFCELIVKCFQIATAKGEQMNTIAFPTVVHSSSVVKLVSLLLHFDIISMNSRTGLYLISGIKSNSFASLQSFRSTLLGLAIPAILPLLPPAICILRVKNILECLLSCNNIFSDKSLRPHMDKLLTSLLARSSETVLSLSDRDPRLSRMIKALPLSAFSCSMQIMHGECTASNAAIPQYRPMNDTRQMVENHAQQPCDQPCVTVDHMEPCISNEALQFDQVLTDKMEVGAGSNHLSSTIDAHMCEHISTTSDVDTVVSILQDKIDFNESIHVASNIETAEVSQLAPNYEELTINEYDIDDGDVFINENLVSHPRC